MCGIAGFYSKKSNLQFDLNHLSHILMASMKHRGPDDEGYWVDDLKNLMLCQVRLSILDLSEKGHQPMLSHNKKFVIVFNGEIYNHYDIRKYLSDSGFSISWNSESDTETLIESIVCLGIEKTLKMAIGMFAFSLWNIDTRTLVLARDRFGEKPLYWGIQSDMLFFASELVSITQNPFFEAKINRDALNQLIRYNYIPAPNSIFKDIFKLIPGQFLSVNTDTLKCTFNTYWNLEESVDKIDALQRNIPVEEAINQLDNKLTSVIERQMLSDVPVGAFLSGGVDSSTIVAYMQKVSKSRIKTYSIGFHNQKFNEAVHAKDIANYLKTDHTELYINDSDVLDVIPKINKIYSEPFADSSQIPTYLLCEMVSKHVTVALSGDAGDELFGGYNQYQFTPKLWRLISKLPLNLREIGSSFLESFNLNQRFEKINYLLPAANKYDFYKRMVSHWYNADNVVLNSREANSYLSDFKGLKDGFEYQENLMFLDAITYMSDDILVKVDRAAMSNSLETRVPFLDHELFEFVWSLPFNTKINKASGKWILKQVLEKYVPRNMFERPKQGFSVPLADWLRGPLKEWAEELLSSTRLKEENYFNFEIIRRIWKLHLTGKKDYSLKLWSILMFQAWLDENKKFIKG